MTYRLLFVIDNLGSGGAQRQLVTLAKGLKALGHNVEFFVYAPGEHFLAELQEAKIPVFSQRKQGKYSLKVISSLRQQLKGRRYALVLAYLSTPSFYSIIASRLVKNRPRVVTSERNNDLSEGRPWQENMVRSLYRLADFVVTNSNYQRLTLLKQRPWLKNKITTIHNGLDLERFYPADQTLPQTSLKLIAIGSLKREKNALCLVHALNILARDYDLYPEVSWVGKHFDQSTPQEFAYGQQVKQEIHALGLTKQWNWLYERTDVIDLLHQHHALVHPSYREGFPNVVCEALACGRPVILSNTLEHPNIVTHGQSGFLFDSQDPYELALAIKALHDFSPCERHQMGLHGRHFAEQMLSSCVMVDQYEKLFTDLVVR